MSLDKYKTFVFDCDGVILNSNKIKTQAFYQVALPYGDLAAKALAEYHTKNGGISRYKKFDYFFDHIIPKGIDGPNKDALLISYAELVREGLIACEITPGLNALRDKTESSKWLVVSGSDQAELRWIFKERGLSNLFNGGIFGSPDSKDEILNREIKLKNIVSPALFFGDSEYDHKVAMKMDFDFIFISSWSEFLEHKIYCEQHSLVSIPRIENFLELKLL
jgi:phosphoglycolate phosphatase-like HAD superfamily hydrolase